MKRFVFLVLVVLAALPGERIVAQDAPVTTALTGSAFVYAVRAGDTLRTIGARFGASKSTLVRLGPDRPGPLIDGEWLFLDNRHIAVLDGRAQISINAANRRARRTDRRHPAVAGVSARPVLHDAAASARRSAAFFSGLSMASLISSTPGAT